MTGKMVSTKILDSGHFMSLRSDLSFVDIICPASRSFLKPVAGEPCAPLRQAIDGNIFQAIPIKIFTNDAHIMCPKLIPD